MARSVAMDGRVWRRLPFELVGMVLSFLPVPDLCRCRAVCKSWDSLISTSKLRTLSRHNARKGPGYIVARVFDNSRAQPKFHGWSVLDLDARRWYRIEHDQTPIYDPIGSDHDGVCIATDAGLVCELVFWWSKDAKYTSLVNIFNPLMRREIALLPDLPFCCKEQDPSCGEVNIVANVDGSFKVFFVNVDFGCWCYCEDPDKPLSRCVLPIFDSNSGQWRSSTNPPLPDSPYEGLIFSDSCSSVMFQGHLVVLFSAAKKGKVIYRLLSYNIDQDMWEDTGVYIIDSVNRIRSRPQLIVSDDRLFYLAWILEEADVSLSFCVCEVSLANEAHWRVFKMTRALVQLVFRTEETGDDWKFDVRSDIVGMGSNKSLILMSKKTGIAMEYDLVHNSLDRLPTNPMHPLPDGCELRYGSKTMDLCLPDRGRQRERKLSTAARGVNEEAGPSQTI